MTLCVVTLLKVSASINYKNRQENWEHWKLSGKPTWLKERVRVKEATSVGIAMLSMA